MRIFFKWSLHHRVNFQDPKFIYSEIAANDGNLIHTWTSDVLYKKGDIFLEIKWCEGCDGRKFSMMLKAPIN